MAEQTFYVKRNDTREELPAALKNSNGAVNLTGATVVFSMRDVKTRRLAVDRVTSTIVSAALGTVKHTWLAAHTRVAGEYSGEWEVTFPDGGIETFPNRSENKLLIIVTPDEA